VAYAVIFVSKLKDPASPSYAAMADKMEEFVKAQPGYLGIDSVRNGAGEGITVSYWESLQAIEKWKADERHIVAQKRGQGDWYAHYKVIVAQSIRNYSHGAAA
jgi:heme-degrading monooxygenase HmoA